MLPNSDFLWNKKRKHRESEEEEDGYIWKFEQTEKLTQGRDLKKRGPAFLKLNLIDWEEK